MPRNTWQCTCGKRNGLFTTSCEACRLLRRSHEFDELVVFLHDRGFDVTLEETPPGYRLAHFTGNGVRGGFATHGVGYRYVEGRVVADNARCFDKWSTSPLVVRIPVDDAYRARLMEHLAFLASKDGFKWSRQCKHLVDRRLPYEVA